MNLLQECNNLTLHHYNNCDAYKNIIDILHSGKTTYNSIEEIPFLPVRIFKERELYSIPKEKIFKVLTSSGTTGQVPSKIFLDKEAAELQTITLSNSIKSVLGSQRLPMVIVDAKKTIKQNPLPARGAGILGMMNYGYKPFFALNDDMSPDINGLISYLNQHQNVFIFGFTFMVWQFYQQVKNLINFQNAILIHSGGWKKLQNQSIDNASFKSNLSSIGINKVYNFYGMVEQIGSIFLEDDGFLYTAKHSDVIIRDLNTLQPLPNGTPGVIQVISSLPKSYPGHSILTEDIGVIHHTNSSGSKAFSVLGRVAKVELRGCSDVTN